MEKKIYKAENTTLENIIHSLKIKAHSNIKNIFVTVLVMIGLFYSSLKLLLVEQQSLLWTFGVIILYLCNYFIIEIFSKVISVERRDSIIQITLKLLVPLFSLKTINGLLYRKNIYFLLGIIISSIIIIAVEWIYNKQNYTKNILKLDNIQNTLISLIPLFLLRSGSSNILILLSPIIIGKICRKEKFSKEQKIIGSIIVLFLSTLVLSAVFNDVEKAGIKDLKGIIKAMVAFYLLINSSKKNINYKNIILVMICSVAIFYFPMLLKILTVDSNLFGMRLKSFTGINDTALILGIINLIYIYMINDKKYEFFPYFILNTFLLLLTGSRGPLILTVVLSFIIITLYKKSKANIIGFLVALLIGVVVMFNSGIGVAKRLKDDSGSNMVRVIIYKESLRQFLEKPLLGHGPGNYMKVSLEHNAEEMELISKKKERTFEEFIRYDALALARHSHNSILILLTSSGIFSLVFYASLMIYLIYLISFLYIKSKEKRVLLGLMIIVYFGLYGMVENLIFEERLQLIQFYMIALVYLYGHEKIVENKQKRG